MTEQQYQQLLNKLEALLELDKQGSDRIKTVFQSLFEVVESLNSQVVVLRREKDVIAQAVYDLAQASGNQSVMDAMRGRFSDGHRIRQEGKD